MKKLVKKTTIGGQALFEGILMKGPNSISIVVRKPDGELEYKIINPKLLSNKFSIFKYPFFRGIAALIDAIKLGGKAIDYSVSFIEDEEKECKKSKIGNIMKKFLSGIITFGIGLLFVFIFFFLPTMISNYFSNITNSVFVLNFIEGIVRIIFFFIYILTIGKLKDVKRIFMYHGAEHKTIATYEFGEELTVENVRQNSMLHPRCGTSFMFNIVIISSLILTFFGWPNPIIRFATRILILPLLVGITYELNRWIGGSDSKLACYLSKPGMFIQKIGTVKEPTDDMIEVAIEALKMVIPENEKDDIWV